MSLRIQNDQLNRGADRSGNPHDDLAQGQSGNILTVNAHNAVSAAQPGAQRRRVVYGGDDHYLPVLHLNLHPDAFQLPALGRVQLFDHFGTQKNAVPRIAQGVHHPIDGTVGKGFRFHRRPIHVIPLNGVPRLRHEPKIGDGIRRYKSQQHPSVEDHARSHPQHQAQQQQKARPRHPGGRSGPLVITSIIHGTKWVFSMRATGHPSRWCSGSFLPSVRYESTVRPGRRSMALRAGTECSPRC